MASTAELRDYFAYWLQLDKGLVLDGVQVEPIAVIQQDTLRGDRLSSAFEDLWARALRSPQKTYLDGTSVSLAELLTGEWEMVLCARCPMPIPLKVGGGTEGACPCHEMTDWPNSETIVPHLPVSTPDRLSKLCDRLKN
jgi:hypothetical protein